MISPTGLSPSLAHLSRWLRLSCRFVTPPGTCNLRTITSLYTQRTTLADYYMRLGLGSSPFARRYLGNRFAFFSSRYLDVSLPWVRPEHSTLTTLLTNRMIIVECSVTPHYQSRVAPFGYPRIYGRVHLPVAFRSLPRPSSPSRA